MNCPKCTDRHGNPTLMVLDNSIGGSSTLERHAQVSAITGWSCKTCGKWIEHDAVKVKVTTFKRETPNCKMQDRIRALISDNWEELQALRSQGIAWATIVKTGGYDCAAVTLGKHHREMVAERYPDAPKPKRGQYFNHGVQQKFVKQEHFKEYHI